MQRAAGGERICLTQRADHQLRIGVHSDRQVAATDAAAHDQGAVSPDFESAPRIRAAQGPLRGKDRSSVAQSDLTAMRVAGKSDVERFIFQQQQSVRRMRQENADLICVLECLRHIGAPNPRVVDPADRNGVEGGGLPLPPTAV